jgi:Wiskott-Aldrich syndrome protein
LPPLIVPPEPGTPPDVHEPPPQAPVFPIREPGVRPPPQAV